jgi:hypothetical protein
VAHYVLPDTLAAEALKHRRLVAYELLLSGGLRNVTPFYRARLGRGPLRLPAFLDIREPLSEVHLGEGWWLAEENHRWMRRRAALELRPAGSTLVLRGFAPDSRMMTVTMAGEARTIPVSAGAFEVKVPVPAAARGGRAVRIAIELDRVSMLPGDERELGAAFGTAEILP